MHKLETLWTKKDLISATNGTDPTYNFLKKIEIVSGISIDSRSIKVGDLFIALKGENFNGHDFVNSAIHKGANGVIVSDKKLAEKYEGLLVKDTKQALINIAKFGRKRFKGKTIALTGSNGKTTTKYFIYKSLFNYGKTHYTHGNNNNIIGLSLTLSRLPQNYDYCVLELGISKVGEMTDLAKLALPDIALITNVSNSHIQNFRNEKEIASEKSNIFAGIKPKGIVILYSDNVWCDYLVKKAKEINAKIHLYGFSDNANTKIINIKDYKEGSKIYFDHQKSWYLNFLNTTQAVNAIATVAIAKELKLNLTHIFNTITNIKPLSGRGEKIIINFEKNHKSLLIDDSYNANPISMKYALSDFKKFQNKFDDYETILIIGDMLELGRKSKELHLRLIPAIKEINPNLLITVGNYTNFIAKQLSSFTTCISYKSIEKLLHQFDELIKPKQLILVKGSNGTGLWKLVKTIKKKHQETHNAA